MSQILCVSHLSLDVLVISSHSTATTPKYNGLIFDLQKHVKAHCVQENLNGLSSWLLLEERNDCKMFPFLGDIKMNSIKHDL